MTEGANVISWLLSAKDTSAVVFEGAATRLERLGLLSEGVSKKGLAMGAGMVAAGAIIAKGIEAVVDKTLAFEDAFAKMNRSLGSSKKEGEAWDEVFRKVYSASPKATLDSVSAALGFLGRTVSGTKDEIGDMAVTAAKLARINGEEVQPIVEGLALSFNRWNIGIDETNTKADLLTRVSQKTGASIAELVNGVKTGAQQFQLAGLSYDQSITLLGTLSKNGIDAAGVIQFLAKAEATISKEASTANTEHAKSVDALQKLADKYKISSDKIMENVDKLHLGKAESEKFAEAQDKVRSSQEAMTKAGGGVTKMLDDVFHKIRAATGPQEAYAIAVEAFGARAGKMATAIYEGKLSLDDLTKAFGSNKGALDKTLEANTTLEGKMNAMKRQVDLAEESIGRGLTPVLLAVIQPISDVVKSIGSFLAQNPEIAKWVGFILAGVAALLIFAGTMKIIMTIAGAFKSVGVIFSFLTGRTVAQTVATEALAVATEELAVAEGTATAAGIGMLGPIAIGIAAVAAIGIGLHTAFSSASVQAELFGKAVSAVTEDIQKNITKMSVEKIAAEFHLLSVTAHVAGEDVKVASIEHKIFADVLRNHPESAQKYISAIDRAGGQTDKFVEQMKKSKQWLDFQQASLLAGASAALTLEQAHQRTTAAQEELTQALMNGQKPGADAAESQRTIMNATNEAKGAIINQLAVLADQRSKLLLSSDAAHAQADALVTLKGKFPELDDAIQGEIDRLNSIPATKQTDVYVNTSSAISQIENLKNVMSGVPGYFTWGGHFVPTAEGGIFNRPQLRLFAEAGAEAVLPLTDPKRSWEILGKSGLLDTMPGFAVGNTTTQGVASVSTEQSQGNTLQLVVNNPVPEPASDTLQRRMQTIGKLGLWETAPRGAPEA